MTDSVAPRWRRQWVLVAYIASIIIVSVQHLALGDAGHKILLIYRTASTDLLAGRNIYRTHADLGLDYFRYSPTFALFFLPLAALPVAASLVLWNALNALALYAAVGALLPARQARVVCALVLADLVRSMQYSHSNGLVAAIMVAGFVAYERGRPARAAWAVAGGAAIKIFPLDMGLFALLRPDRARAVAWIALAGVAMVLLPALVIGPHMLVQQYHWWMRLEAAETAKPMYALMDLIDAWTGRYWPRWPTQLVGLALLLGVVARRRDAWADAAFRLRLLGAVLVFSVLFNHGAESPSYVIALTGIAVWWVTTPRSALHDVLLLLTLLLVTVGRSSLVPRDFRLAVLDPARTIVMPLVAVWVVMLAELLRLRSGPEVGQTEVAALEPTP